MQDKSDSNPTFSDRTDALAVKLGVRVVDLPDVLKISADMLMGYRTGRYPISSKAWRKLEAAEALHGLATIKPRAAGAAGLCAKIREEFYIPSDSDFVGLTPSERAEVLRAMADSIDEMERRQAAYAARARREGMPGNAAAEAEADRIIAEAEAEVKGSKPGHGSHGSLGKAS